MVSIIVPCYNSARYLRLCIDSLLNQTYRLIEVILVDDGSTDSTPEICEEYVRMDSRIKVFHIKNGGVSKARNYGLKQCSGEWVAFVDSDDRIAPQMYESLIQEARDDVDVVCCDILMEESKGSNIYCTFEPSDNPEETIKRLLLSGWGGVSVNRIVRKSLIIEKMLYYPEDIHYCEDLVASTQVFYCSRKSVKVHEPCYIYNRLNTASATHTFDEKKEDESLLAMSYLCQFCKDVGLYYQLEKVLMWHILLCKVEMVISTDRQKKFLTVSPEANKYIADNPFLHRKMKIAMWLICHHFGFMVPVIAKMRQLFLIRKK